MKSFAAKIQIIGINPYVSLPQSVLEALFKQAGRSKGPIPVRGTLNGKQFTQTLVKYRGAWRLYLNTPMRRDAGIDVGDEAIVGIEFDPKPRIVPMPPEFAQALSKSREARAAFAKLAPSRQREILRYLNSLKTDESLVRNIEKVIQFLSGRRPKGLTAIFRIKN